MQRPSISPFGAVLVLLPGIVCFFSVFYLVADYECLADWYLGLNSCFYRVAFWKQDFFTTRVKEQGNLWCVLAVVASIATAIYVIKNINRKSLPTSAIKRPAGENRGLVMTLLLVGLGLWCYTNALLKPGYDEIFSAVNIAALPAFQTMSYYMLPNNHIFFNVLNNDFLGLGIDKVFVGRIISLIAYLATLAFAFRWFSSLVGNKFYAFAITLLLSMQLPTLGFSAQARGYELELLAGLASFVSLFRFLDGGDTKDLRSYCIWSFVGYITIPSFLYFHLALLLFAFTWQVMEKFRAQFWEYSLVSLILVFFFYLPALCFSGIGSFTENKYVVTTAPSFRVFLNDFPSLLQHYIAYGFSFIIKEEHPVNYIIFLLPCGLICASDRKTKMLGIFYLLLWVVCISMILVMQRFPFKRNLIIHYSLTLGLVAYALYVFNSFVSERFNLRAFGALFMLPVLLIGLHLAVTFKPNVQHMLYGTNGNELFQGNMASISRLKKGASVAFSEESFYWYYYCKKQPFKVNKCGNGNEDYFVKRTFESLPELYSKYKLTGEVFESYEIYKKL